MEPVLGIDLGTTNSVVAIVKNGVPHVIQNRSGYKLTPSVVALAQNGKQLVGSMARRQAVTNPKNTIYAAKRLIGRKYASKEVQLARDLVPYEIVAGEHDDVRVLIGGQALSVPELSAVILAELKRDAEAYLGQAVTKAVITVPAHFNDAQRQATKDAGRIAGLDVLRIINEPTSAALAYLGAKPPDHACRLVVFDLGGGTFDVSVLDVVAGVYRVMATGGDTFLGGQDFDNRVVEWLVFGFAKDHQVDLRKDRMAMQRVRDAAEKAKCDLSDAQEAQINLPFIFSPAATLAGGFDGKTPAAVHLMRSMSRAKLEELTQDLIERALQITERTLAEAGLSPSKVSDVLLVGGQSRMPKVQDAVRSLFGREPLRGVNPDEVVALGAAIQGNALLSETSKMLLLDVTPLSLGITVAGGYSAVLIPKNTTVPTSASHTFSTVRDYQTSVKIMVLQGEDQRAEENELLGEFLLSGLRSAMRGEVAIDVTFSLSADGIVSVQARDQETGGEASITVAASSGLTPAELKRIIDEQRDNLLELRQADETRLKADELRGLAADLERLLPDVHALIAGSEFGPDAIAKAERTHQRGVAAARGNDLGVIVSAIEAIEITLQLFRGILAKLGAVRP